MTDPISPSSTLFALSRTSLNRVPEFSALQLTADGLIQNGLSTLARPEVAALFLGGGALVSSRSAYFLFSEARLALAEWATMARASSTAATRPALAAAIPLLLAGCSPDNPSRPGDGGGDGTSPSHDAGVVPTPPPVYQNQQTYGEVPCGPGSMISDLDWDSQGGLGVCSKIPVPGNLALGPNPNGDYRLFRWDPFTSGAIQTIIPLPFPSDQVLRLSTGEIVISSYKSPALGVIDDISHSESSLPFPNSILPDRPSSSGRSLSAYTPGYPKGLLELNNRIFVATSNYDEGHRDYLPGTVLAFNPVGVIRTRGFNPTSLARVNYEGSPALLVVSTGAVDRYGHPITDSRLEIYDPTTLEELWHHNLGNVAAGFSGEAAVTPDGHRVVLPTGDNSGRIFLFDLQTNSIQTISLRDHGATTGLILLTHLQLSQDGRYAFTGNFNDGHLYVVDLENPSSNVQRILVDSNLLDGEGLSDGLLRGAHLFVGWGSRIQQVNF